MNSHYHPPSNSKNQNANSGASSINKEITTTSAAAGLVAGLGSATTNSGMATELPRDLLAEKSLLGCLLIDGSAFDDIASLALKKEDFYHPHYRIVFEGILDLVAAQRPVDYVTLCSRLADTGKLDNLGSDGDLKGPAFILNLSEEQASTANVFHYAKAVKEKSILRNIIRTASKVVSDAFTYAGDSRHFISKVEASFFKITQEIRSGGVKKLSNCLLENLAELESGKFHPGELSGLSTGFTHLDSILLGMQAGQLIITAARPGMGKTSLALNIALNCTKKSGLPVVIFSLEMLAHELGLRILSMTSHIEFKKLRTKNLKEGDVKRIGNSIQSMASYPIFIIDDGNVTILDVQSECRKIKTEYGMGLVVVDYVQLLRSHTDNPSREQQISEISRGLKLLAKELECPVMALSQLNRGVESRVDKRPLISDLRESGALEQDADIVLLIYRDEFYFPETTKERGIAEIIVGKNRAGETGTVKVAFKGEFTSFANITPDAYSDLPDNNQMDDMDFDPGYGGPRGGSFGGGGLPTNNPPGYGPRNSPGMQTSFPNMSNSTPNFRPNSSQYSNNSLNSSRSSGNKSGVSSNRVNNFNGERPSSEHPLNERPLNDDDYGPEFF